MSCFDDFNHSTGRFNKLPTEINVFFSTSMISLYICFQHNIILKITENYFENYFSKKLNFQQSNGHFTRNF